MVVEYVTSLKAAWEVAKALKIATDSINDAEIELQIADLMSALADAKIEAAESVEKIADLEKQLKTRSSFEFDGKKYYRNNEDGTKDGPYCPTCYDSNAKEIRLKNVQGNWAGDWHCEVFSGSFE